MTGFVGILSALFGVWGRKDEKGATAVEYGLLVALIAGVIILAVTLLGGNLATLFSDVASRV